MIDKLILIIKYIIVALVQGIGEILPISSSGHMIIIQNILGLNASDLTFEILLCFVISSAYYHYMNFEGGCHILF